MGQVKKVGEVGTVHGHALTILANEHHVLIGDERWRVNGSHFQFNSVQCRELGERLIELSDNEHREQLVAAAGAVACRRALL